MITNEKDCMMENKKDNTFLTKENSTFENKKDDNMNYEKNCCFININKKMILSKLFYFFFFFANGSLLPYMALHFKQMLLTPTEVISNKKINL